ncbi:MAG: hypothetical protein COA36_16400 [Desulfotalea sp.]|nr:MAG: hypothetical protein COA36_16400 [Desulfotalea sp.]
MNKISILVAFIFLIISGCSSTGVIPMSQDSYFIGKKDGSPGLGVSFINKAEVYQEANAFCDKKSLELLTLRESVIPAVPGRLGSTELHFKCVQPGGTAQLLIKNPNDMYTELKKLAELKKIGIITKKEFDTEKSRILARY